MCMYVYDEEGTVFDVKHDRGMEVQYMLFCEMLSDERREGRIEGQDTILKLISSMKAGSDADKIPLLAENPELLRSMYDKYLVEI